jgi:hypothetical protein
MRLFVKSVLLLFACSFILISCSKKEDPYAPVYPGGNNGGGNGGGNGSSGTFSAKVDGNDFNPADSIQAVIMNGAIVVSAKHNGAYMVISADGESEGTYVLDTSLGISSVSYTKFEGDITYASVYENGVVGEVVITQIDEDKKTVSGTFHARVARYDGLDLEFVEITSGEFKDVTYTTTVPPTTGSTIKADIDGVTFTAPSVSGMVQVGKIALNGTDGSRALGIFLDQTITPGTYSMDLAGNNVAYSPTMTTPYFTQSGTIVVTKHDVSAKRIEGTFFLTAEDLIGGGPDIIITNGEFAVTYQ